MQCGGRPGLMVRTKKMKWKVVMAHKKGTIWSIFVCHGVTFALAARLLKLKALLEKVIEGKLCYRFPLFQFYLKDTDKKTWHEGRVFYFKKYLIKNLINFYNLRYEIIHNICLCLRFIVIIPKFYWIFY